MLTANANLTSLVAGTRNLLNRLRIATSAGFDTTSTSKSEHLRQSEFPPDFSQ
jgi:hypothetical protein